MPVPVATRRRAAHAAARAAVWAVGIALAASLLACHGLAARLRGPRPDARHVRVLFVGNSYTYVNDLPKTVTTLAEALGDSVDATMDAVGGRTFQQAAADGEVLARIGSGGWNVVVLQEQSQRPAFADDQVDTDVAPYADTLARAVREAGASPLFYQTWAHREGDPQNCQVVPEVCDYAGMQHRLIHTYDRLATASNAGVAPVGEAWSAIRDAHPEIDLYGGDGVHPSVAGTYLAACVFYEVLTGHDVHGAPPLTLDARDARALQDAAHSAVSARHPPPTPTR